MQLTVRQVAELLHVPDAAVRKWIRECGLPAVNFNEQCRLNRTDLVVWAQANRIVIPETLLAGPVGGTVSLAAALEEGGIHRSIVGSDRASVLRATLEHLSLPKEADRELIRDMLTAREERGSNAAGHGIAVPHLRHPIIASVPRPALALAYLAESVDFRASDGVRVDTLFLLVAPTIRAHLRLLTRLASALSTAAFSTAVRAREDDDAILRAARAVDAESADAPTRMPES